MAVELPKTCQTLPSREDFDDLVRRANSGDQDAIRDLRSVLKNRPEIWESLGDLSSHAQTSLIRAIPGTNQLVLTSIEQKVEELRAQLLGPSPSALERLLVGRVVVSFLEVEYATAKYPADEAANLATAKFAVQLKTGAQRRFDAAVKSLMLVQERMPAIERANRDQRDRRKIIRLPGRVSA